MTIASPVSTPAGQSAAAARPGLTPMDDALAQMLARIESLEGCETLSTFDALGRVLAEEVRSLLDVPPADNTSMDGYAMRVADVPAEGTLLPVSQRVPAGVVGEPLQPGTAARIFTGAQLPPGADAVVMQEQCSAVSGEGLGAVQVNTVPTVGQWIRRRGEDVQHGSRGAGRRHAAHARGAGPGGFGGSGLADGGAPPACGAVLHRRRTGDAGRAAEARRDLQLQPLHPAWRCCRASVARWPIWASCPTGWTPPVTRCARPRPGNDLILTSGGVSVGEEDHIKPAVEAEGRLTLWQMAMKPGKPLAFGEVRRPAAEGGAACSWACPATRCRAS
jgi:molybdopterin molybdotransferase